MVWLRAERLSTHSSGPSKCGEASAGPYRGRVGVSAPQGLGAGPVGLRLLGSSLLQLMWGGAGPGATRPSALCARGPVSSRGVAERALGRRHWHPRAGGRRALVCLLGAPGTVLLPPTPALCPHGAVLARMEPAQDRPQAQASPGSELRPSASHALASHGLLSRWRDTG